MLFHADEPQFLDVPHIQQIGAGECLTACAAMLCAYLQIDLNYAQLQATLQHPSGIGVPMPDINRLEKFGLTTIFRRDVSFPQLYSLLKAGWPTIAGVQTNELPHWNNVPSQHAVVVTGMAGNTVYINDPEMPRAPTPVPINEFDLAWFAQGQTIAVFTL